MNMNSLYGATSYYVSYVRACHRMNSNFSDVLLIFHTNLLDLLYCGPIEITTPANGVEPAPRACLVAACQAARRPGSTIRPQADEIGRLGLLPGPGSFVRV